MSRVRTSYWKQRLSPLQFAMLRALFDGKSVSPRLISQTTLASLLRRGYLVGTAEEVDLTDIAGTALTSYFELACPMRKIAGEVTDHVSSMLALSAKRKAS